MKSALIVSIPDLDVLDCIGNTYHLTLPHLYESDAYMEFYRRRAEYGDWLIQDNSCFELHPDEAWKIDSYGSADRIGASEIVVPEYPWDCDKTIERCEWFLEKWKNRLDDYPLMAIAHAENWEGLKKCYEYFSKNAHITSIGLTYRYKRDAFDRINEKLYGLGWYRFSIIRRLIAEKIWNYDKPHHLFGMLNPAEFSVYNSLFPHINIRGFDTSYVYTASYFGVQFDEDYGVCRKVNQPIDFNWNYDYVYQNNTFWKNVELVRMFCRGIAPQVFLSLYEKEWERKNEELM